MAKKKEKKAGKRMKKKELSQAVLDFFHAKQDEGISLKYIFSELKLTTHPLKMLCMDILADLLTDDYITEVDKNKYKLNNHGVEMTGTFQRKSNGKNSFIPEGGGDPIFVAERNSAHAMNNDKVRIAFYAKRRGREAEGEVIEILERANDTFVGTLEVEKSYAFLVTENRTLANDIFIPKDKLKGGKTGDKAVVKVTEWPDKAKNPIGQVLDILGKAGDNTTEMHAILAEFGLPYVYPQSVEKAADKIPAEISAEEIARREDFRKVTTFTIDPKDAKDFDDALSIRPLKDGLWEVGVHIADVTHYVKEGSIIDKEAEKRATSVYLVDRTIPMLPERLSNGICSLRPDEDRLAFTVDIELDAQGRVRHYDPYPSVIRSRVRMDYDGAEALLVRAGAVEYSVLEGAAEDVAAAETSREEALERGLACEEAARGYNIDLGDFLVAANELAELRRRIRRARGSVDFDTAEIRALLDEDGVPVQIVARERSCATSLIEEAMLLANECVAEWLADRDIEACYRVHEDPSPDSLHGAAVALAQLGIIDDRRAAGIALGSPDELQAAVDAAAGTANAPLVNTLLLRSMQRALYKPRNEGHFALAAPCYCHFTSPIRRYPDLVVHRVLKLQLAYEQLGGKDALVRTPRLIGKGRESLPRILPQICRACSDAERAADAASHATQKIKIAQYYEDRLGERYAGTVSWVSSMGLFVRLDLTQVEGLVSIKSLGNEWFEFDEDALTLTGADTGTRYELGQRVIIEVSRVNTTRGHLDFKLIH